jgi:hypothetical protein
MNTKPKKLKDGKVFTIYLDKPHLEHVKRVARHMSIREGRDISACEAIRMALETIYPMDTQLDMFGESKKKRLKREYEEKNQLKFEGLQA